MSVTGNFQVTIAGSATAVQYKIYGTYEVHASFTTMGKSYTFKMLRWKKTAEGTKSPRSSFDAFASLSFDRLGDLVPNNAFGARQEIILSTGTEHPFEVTRMTDEQRFCMLKYAMIDVFICAEEIIKVHGRSLLDYCIFHQELEKDKTYEQYIHLVACHCLVHSNFLAPGISHLLVNFAMVEKKFDREIWEQVSKVQNVDSLDN